MCFGVKSIGSNVWNPHLDWAEAVFAHPLTVLTNPISDCHSIDVTCNVILATSTEMPQRKRGERKAAFRRRPLCHQHRGSAVQTMVDALLPFAETFSKRVSEGVLPNVAWAEAAAAATSAAQATASLRPLKGRARPLAEKSVGTADPGATSLAMIFTVMGPHLVRPENAGAVAGAGKRAGAIA